MEQPPWGPLRPAAVLRIPGRFPFLLRNTGSVTHTHSNRDTTLTVQSAVTSQQPLVCTLVRVNQRRSFSKGFLVIRQAATRYSVTFFLWKKTVSAAACDGGCGPCLSSRIMAFTSDLLPSSNDCIQQQLQTRTGPLTDVCISPADTPARPSLGFESAAPLTLPRPPPPLPLPLRRGQFLPPRFSSAEFSLTTFL